VNSGQNNIIYNTSMYSLDVYGLEQRGEQALNRPHGIAANGKGHVYVADTGHHRVVHLFNPGRKLQYVGSIGRKGTGPSEFLSPFGVALDSQGRVYVTDTGNHRVQIFSPHGTLLRIFGKKGTAPGEFLDPTGIAVTDFEERWSYYHDSFLVVIDKKGQRLQKFSLEGKFLKAIEAQDFGYPTAQLAYLAIDYFCNIYATDRANSTIHKFDRFLNYLTSFGRYGTGDKEFVEPRGIAIYRRFGQVFIAERESGQYYWIGTDIQDLQARYVPESRILEVSYFLTEPSFVTVDVLNSRGKKLCRIFEKLLRFSGKRVEQLRIELSDKKPLFVKEWGFVAGKLFLPRGRFRLRFKVEPTYSSYRHFAKEVETEFDIP